MSSYSWPVYPCSGSDNFELNARNSLETWRTNSVAIEARLNDIEDGTFWATSGQVIDGSAIIDGTLAYSAFDGLLPYDQIEAAGTALESYVLVYRSAGDGFVWESIAGVIGQDSYTVKWDATSGTAFLTDWVASQAEAETGTAADKVMTPQRVEQAIQALVPELPAGMISPFAMETAPDGWIYCDGSEKDPTASEYLALFTAIGVTFGGNGTTTFNLPDYRDEFLRGSSSTRDVGESESDATRSHTHSATASVTGGNHTHRIAAGDSYASVGAMAASSLTSGWYGYTEGDGGHTHSASVSVGTNSGAGSETRPRSSFVYYCIKL